MGQLAIEAMGEALGGKVISKLPHSYTTKDRCSDRTATHKSVYDWTEYMKFRVHTALQTGTL